MAASDVFVTFGGDTGALEAAVAAVKSQMGLLSGEMRKVANEFNRAGAAADSELSKKLKGLGVQLAAAKGQMAGLQSGAKLGGDAIKDMGQKIGDAAYNYGPWTGVHVQLAQAIGVGLATGASDASAAVSVLGGALGIAAAATVASVAIIASQVRSLRDLDDAARAAHISIAALRNLNTAGKGVGIDAEQMNQEMGQFALKLREAQVAGGDLADFLEKNNVAIKSANGNLLPVQQIFGKIAEMILRSNNEMDRLAALSKLGFSGDILRLIERQTDAVKIFAASSKSAQDEVAAHALSDGEKFSTAWHSAYDELKESALSAAVAVIDFDAKVRNTIPTFADLTRAGKTAFAEIASSANSSAASIGAAIGKMAVEQERAAAILQGAKDVASGKSPFGALDTHAFDKPASKDIAGLYDKDTKTPKAAKGGKADRDGKNAEMKGYEDSIKAAQTSEKAKESLLSEGVKLHLISEDEKLAATQKALNEEYATERGLLQKELQIDGLKLAQKQALNDKLKALDEKHAAESEKAYLQSVEKQVQGWDHMVDTMSSSMASGITGMVEHTETFRQAMLSLERDVLSSFVKMGTDVVADWAKKQIALVALSLSTEGQQTAAKLAGATAREGVAAGESASGLGSLIASAVKAITVDAGQAAAGVTAFLAPVMGPAAVGAGAATEGAVLSMAAFDIGAYKLDQDQIAMVHKNEMVMPAAEAGAFRSMLSGAVNGSGPGGAATHNHTHNWNISTPDSDGVRGFFQRNSRALAEGLNSAIGKGDHLGLRNLSALR